jgi:hypothetical protein
MSVGVRETSDLTNAFIARLQNARKWQQHFRPPPGASYRLFSAVATRSFLRGAPQMPPHLMPPPPWQSASQTHSAVHPSCPLAQGKSRRGYSRMVPLNARLERDEM